MILSAQTIRARCTPNDMDHSPLRGWKPMIVPLLPRTVNPRTGTSYGLGPHSYDARTAQGFVLQPLEFLLVSTIEEFTLPNDVAARVEGKSTLLRMGLSAENSRFDAGWSGFATLELFNRSRLTLEFSPGDPIVQVTFELLDQPTEQPYRGKYMNQPSRPVAAVREGVGVGVQPQQSVSSGDACRVCGNFTLVRSGSCFTCITCGSTTGCS